MGRERLITIIAILVAVVWAVVAVVSLVLKDYGPLTIVTPVMLIVTGFLFGTKRNGASNS